MADWFENIKTAICTVCLGVLGLIVVLAVMLSGVFGLFVVIGAVAYLLILDPDK